MIFSSVVFSIVKCHSYQLQEYQDIEEKCFLEKKKRLVEHILRGDGLVKDVNEGRMEGERVRHESRVSCCLTPLLSVRPLKRICKNLQKYLLKFFKQIANSHEYRTDSVKSDSHYKRIRFSRKFD